MSFLVIKEKMIWHLRGRSEHVFKKYTKLKNDKYLYSWCNGRLTIILKYAGDINITNWRLSGNRSLAYGLGTEISFERMPRFWDIWSLCCLSSGYHGCFFYWNIQETKSRSSMISYIRVHTAFGQKQSDKLSPPSK